MPTIDQASLYNRLLRQLQPEDFALWAPYLEPVELPKDKVLVEPRQPIGHAIFPEHGIVSVMSVSTKGLTAESGLIGRDGFTPMGLVLDADHSPQRCIVRVRGDGYRISADALRVAMVISPALHRLLLRYAHTLAMQASYTALSNTAHPIAKRVARLVLMLHDRMAGDEVALTHELIALSLAVRRAGVTTSLSTLKNSGFVQTKRGMIIVTDRQGLEAFADDAYGQPEAEYKRLIGAL